MAVHGHTPRVLAYWRLIAANTARHYSLIGTQIV